MDEKHIIIMTDKNKVHTKDDFFLIHEIKVANILSLCCCKYLFLTNLDMLIKEAHP